jgi:hypothetical protein
MEEVMVKGWKEYVECVVAGVFGQYYFAYASHYRREHTIACIIE